jgi:hypothetical protein
MVDAKQSHSLALIDEMVALDVQSGSGRGHPRRRSRARCGTRRRRRGRPRARRRAGARARSLRRSGATRRAKTRVCLDGSGACVGREGFVPWSARALARTLAWSRVAHDARATDCHGCGQQGASYERCSTTERGPRITRSSAWARAHASRVTRPRVCQPRYPFVTSH